MKIRGVLRWRTAGLLLAMLIIVGLPYMVTQSTSNQNELASAWVTHSTAVRSLTYRVAYVVHDSEAAIYRLLAGDANASTNERSLRADKEVPALLQQLRTMTRDNPQQQLLIGGLENGVNGRNTLMNQALQRLRVGDAEGARQSLRDADDLFVINSQINRIVNNENTLLAAR
ncbi:MAG: CHASE3 domain-containing protein, partial [Rhodanobacter sp.]